MPTKNYITNPKIKAFAERAKEIKASGKVFSDIVDDEGNQYVDLVQEGGGVLGIALTGYTYILEQAGIRFYSLAGTSAGSINTLLMAGMAPIGKPVAEKIMQELAEKDLMDFVDGPSAIKKIIRRKVNGKDVLWNVVFNIRTLYSKLTKNLGLNPGQDFQDWLSRLLEQNEIWALKDLEKLRQKTPELYLRESINGKIDPAKLAIITSEITTHTKVVLPKMAELYWENPAQIPPSEFARASMSIPYFFTPFEVKNIPEAGNSDLKNWKYFASFSGKIPPKVKFVDGGLLSNFPIDVFHRKTMPNKPTFGVRLSTYRENYSETDSFFQFAGGLISTMRQIHDYDFILQNPDYRQLICNINADERFNWLNFDMSQERQQELVTLGAEKALEFLEKFDWEGYKDIRRRRLE